MATSRRRIKFQLYSLGTAGLMAKPIITSAGGVCYVAINGDQSKQAITDKDGGVLANPMALNQGGVEFYVPAATVFKVDVYILTPGGHFITAKDVDEGVADIGVDTTVRAQMAIIPFSITDTAAATETDTGFDLPAKAIVLDRLHGMGVNVKTLDSTHNVAFGVLSSQSGGSANGICTNTVLTTAVLKIGVNGSFFSTNAPFMTDSITGKRISYTLDAGTTTGKGFLMIPYRIVAD